MHTVVKILNMSKWNNSSYTSVFALAAACCIRANILRLFFLYNEKPEKQKRYDSTEVDKDDKNNYDDTVIIFGVGECLW